MNYLALDFGTRHIGVAFSQGYLAEPLTQISYTEEKKAIQSIKHLMTEHKIDNLIVGISEGKMAEKTKKFVKKLLSEFSNPISYSYWDETLTSQLAIKKMIEAGAPRKKRQTQDHKIAAALILQEYLDYQDNQM